MSTKWIQVEVEQVTHICVSAMDQSKRQSILPCFRIFEEASFCQDRILSTGDQHQLKDGPAIKTNILTTYICTINPSYPTKGTTTTATTRPRPAIEPPTTQSFYFWFCSVIFLFFLSLLLMFTFTPCCEHQDPWLGRLCANVLSYVTL